MNINLEAIRHNIREVRKHICKGCKILAVVKADAYGYGSIKVTDCLKKDVDYFAVATLQEGITLRQHGTELPILILGYTSVSEYADLLRYDITQTIYSVDTAKKLSEAAGRLGRTAKVHIAVDTGMTRIGFGVDESGVKAAVEVCGMPYLFVEGVFTHFSKADETDDSYSNQQMKKYDFFVGQLKKAGVHIPIRHVCNSAGILKYPDYQYEMVRSGIITYGMYPSENVDKTILDLQPALEWKAHVINIADKAPGVQVSYGGTFVTEKDTRIATVSVGYADGYPRSLSNCGEVLIRGKRAKILGRICMDQMMVDATGIDDIQMEDGVTLIGRDGENFISIEEAANKSHRLHYELVCNIGQRVKRCY